jgi:alkylated DNA repair dioxygenase AlkB
MPDESTFVQDSLNGYHMETEEESVQKYGRYAITFGEVALLHIGGVEVGNCRRDHGFSVAELREFSATLPRAEVIMVSDALPEVDRSDHEAAVLLLRGGAEFFLGRPDAARLLLHEQNGIEYDRKFFDRGRTKNKLARHNIVFGEEKQAPSEDYRKFSIRAFKELPWLDSFRQALGFHFGCKAEGLNAEGNHYYNSGCGIGFHGDSERKIVICLSLGANSVVRYQWRKPRSTEQCGPAVDLEVQHGDVYVMSEKATGFDWKCRSKLRVVHAAGSSKYIG